MNQPPFENLVERQVEMDLPFDRPLAFIDLTLRDGTTRSEGPYSRWTAEMLVGSGSFISSDVYSLVIRPVREFDRFVGDA